MPSQDCLHLRLSDYLHRRRDPAPAAEDEAPPPPDPDAPSEPEARG